MSKISEFFQDGDGMLSATRLGFLLWVIGLLLVWVSTSLSQGVLQSVPESVAAIVGVLMTGKVVQSFGENGVVNSPSTSPQLSNSKPPTEAPPSPAVLNTGTTGQQ